MSTKEQKERIELLQGTLDLLILRTLLRGPAHGHAVAKAIEFNSDDVLQVEQGSLYPALHRLIKRRWISVEEGTSENNRRAKFYRLTAEGRRQLAVETNKWDKLAGAIARILRPANHESPQAYVGGTQPGHSRPYRERDAGQHRARDVAGGSALCGCTKVRQCDASKGRDA